MVAMFRNAGYPDELTFVGICSVAQGYSECQRLLMNFVLIFFINRDRNNHLRAFSDL
jgi:hypothetical protein